MKKRQAILYALTLTATLTAGLGSSAFADTDFSGQTITAQMGGGMNGGQAPSGMGGGFGGSGQVTQGDAPLQSRKTEPTATKRILPPATTKMPCG